ncbi:MAG: UvrD-helicase domain-containing protein, partial [Acidobacteriaceae bacterium]|nr:UvrD-helicase domain-containing protein [Acidobacteriaceae bacterium]
MTADSFERERALDPSQSFIVEAPAGSGKTGLLVQRYLALLSSVERPETIVAMTFTRKAAAEMKERIHQALAEAASDAPVKSDHERRTRELARAALEHDRRNDWRLLADASRLQIQTIDSLCAMLTRQMPIVSEFGGLGNVLEDVKDLYRLAARRMLRELSEGDAASRELLSRVSLYFDNDISSLERQVARMLDLRDQWFSLERVQKAPLIEDFCHLLLRARDALREVFRERGVVDFTEVTRAAIKALGPAEHPSDLLYRLDYRIEHLLVDEFQDTSRAQYDLITALTGQWSEGDGHTLFLVGDPMQSIYRFRGAEVSLFLRSLKERRLGAVRLTPLHLATNFRSTPELVSWVEAHLSPVMTADDPVHGAVAFRRSTADRPSSSLRPQLIPLIDDEGEQEAAEIVKIIQRAPNPGKVAILVRSRSHIVAILPALRAAGIRYEAIEIDELKEQQHILDLISLTRAVLHLGDRVSWLACLRAPWCGLTLADLSALAEGETKRTIFDLLSDAGKIAKLSPDGRRRALREQSILAAAVETVGRLPLRNLIERAWLAFGGPAILSEPNQREDVQTYLDLLDRFEEGGMIRDFSLLQQRLDCLYAKPKTGGDCVQVMTIFQAKGLEFDTVIIPKLGLPTKSLERELLAWTEQVDEEGGTSLLIAAQPRRSEDTREYTDIAEELKNKERQELKRVFYVGCTRARNELFLLGSAKTKKQGAECSKAKEGTFLHLLWETVQSDFEAVRRRRISDSSVTRRAEAPKTMLRRLPADWQA